MLAIILDRKDFKEVDQIISLYTKEKGKIEALAKGVKKIVSKQSGCLEPFTLVEVEIIKGKEMDHIVKILVVNIFKNIRSNLEKSLLAGYVVKLVDKMVITGEKDKRIFGLIHSWLDHINDATKAEKNLLYGFIVRLLSYLGFLPVLDNCVNCGSRQRKFIGFDIENGGVCCEDCQKILINNKSILLLTTGEINLFKVLSKGTWEETENRGESKRLFEVIREFAQFHCGQKIFNIHLV